ncbi:putative MSF multidrug transporter [Lindgomyces ingoldianus]|uniref:MSF multidrug transporter n=1 Tax=Lindgomyces ingoldianus TaxID=673940 RepID=A0ACB6R5M8_9PLEO|nr:putative MSF multidrug transporter [Lindgomyces ingoldianus]KAF2474588.1 putative MSF multidrug transporter [Lindgomyces ingoldianus]
MAQDEIKNTDDEVPTSSPTVVPNISPARLQVIIAGLWLSIFMSAIDGTIITTGLVKISSDFNALGQAAWLVTTYLLTYNAFLMIVAKLSDVWGLKSILIFCNAFFLIWSMACGASQSMTQLIVFRALQGIGGSGLYSLVFVTLMQLITPDKLGFYSGIISSVFAVANLLGPILGGVISDHTTWRWIFFINGPIVSTALVLLFFSMPGKADGKSNMDRLRNFDFIGGTLSVCWPIPLLFALQEGGANYAWSSGVIIGTLVAGIVGFFLFGCFEAWITFRTKKEAIFPVRFLTNPAMILLLLSQGLQGMPFYVSVIQLPQRFQAVNHTSAERAGILLLPLTLLTPVGSMIGGIVMGRRLHAEYILVISAAVVSIGIGLLSSLPTSMAFPIATYGYEIITGFGLGLGSPPYYYLLPITVAEKDISVATGALNMMRTLGGCVAVAICSALNHSSLRQHLPTFLTPEQVSAVEASNTAMQALPRALQLKVAQVFGESFNRQMKVMLAFTCLNVLATIALVIVRKRRGILGAVPVRREENEFMKREKAKSIDGEKRADSEKANKTQNVTLSKETAEESARQVDEISIARDSGEGEGAAKEFKV